LRWPKRGIAASRREAGGARALAGTAAAGGRARRGDSARRDRRQHGVSHTDTTPGPNHARQQRAYTGTPGKTVSPANRKKVLYYSRDVLQLAGMGDALLASSAVGLAKVAGVLAALALTDRLGRRVLLIGGTTCMALSLCGLAVAFADEAHPSPGLALASLLVFILGWDISWAGLMLAVVAEVRVSAVSLPEITRDHLRSPEVTRGHSRFPIDITRDHPSLGAAATRAWHRHRPCLRPLLATLLCHSAVPRECYPRTRLRANV